MIRPQTSKSLRELRRGVAEVLADVPVDFGGGCGVDKAYLLAALVGLTRTKRSVDIGVYRGRSYFPQALAHKQFTGGRVYGVDPYSKLDAREEDNPPLKAAIDTWIEETDFDRLLKEVRRHAKQHSLGKNSELVRLTSADAAERFRAERLRFGLIHIDGNHDTKVVLDDVQNYLPLLERGGFVVLDDISWDSVRPATAAVVPQLVPVLTRVDSANDYAVFWNGRSAPVTAYLRAYLGWLAAS